MSALQKERRIRAQRALDTQRALYRDELNRVAAERNAAFATAEQATARIAQLLPAAVQAGVSIVEVAQVTGISRPTLYRMLADVRQTQDARSLAEQLGHALGRLSAELGRPALPADLAPYLNVSNDELQTMLGHVFTYLAREVDGLGPSALTALVDLLPGLGKPEKIVLNMLLLQRLPATEVARSTRFSPTAVLAWAGLGLLRLYPELRSRLRPAD